MISALVIVYHGSRPSEDALRRVVEELASLNCCEDIVDVKHLDDAELGRVIANSALVAPTEAHNQYSFEFTCTKGGIEKLAIVKVIRDFAGIDLKAAKDAVDTGHITLSKELDSETLNVLFSNGLVLTKAPDKLMLESAIYVLNSMFRGNDGMFKLVKYLQEYENGERTNVHHAVKGAVDIIYDHINIIKASSLNNGLYDMIRAWKRSH